MTAIKVLLSSLALTALTGIAFAAEAPRSDAVQANPPAAASHDKSLVKRGGVLAAMGDCAVCHTKAGGKLFAGGRLFETPFGKIYSSNITPDTQTGIGRWTEADFQRAMREGVDREGHHIYPVFPYDHFTLVTDEDDKAIYAYLMSLPAVYAKKPKNEVRFPYNTGLALAGWNLLYLKKGPYQPDPKQSAAWNRGAYLVDGLGHCGACHTPRNEAGAEKKDQRLDGADVEGWHAYAINSKSPAPTPWTKEALAFYLRHGWQQQHGMARGPMSPVVENLAVASDDDIDAIATYLSSLTQKSASAPEKGEEAKGAATSAQTRPEKLTSADSQISPPPANPQAGNDEGARIYAAACANCHEAGRPLPFGGINLALSTALQAPAPRNLVNVTLYGLPASSGEQSAIMPGFRASLSDSQIEALTAYLRSRFSSKPAWTNVGELIRQARKSEPPLYPAPGMQTAPDDPSQKGVAW